MFRNTFGHFFSPAAKPLPRSAWVTPPERISNKFSAKIHVSFFSVYSFLLKNQDNVPFVALPFRYQCSGKSGDLFVDLTLKTETVCAQKKQKTLGNVVFPRVFLVREAGLEPARA